MVNVPDISTRNFLQMKGTTARLGSTGAPADYQKFTVTKAGEFNFKIEDSYTNVQVMNSRNEVVANLRSNTDVAEAQAKLGPGTYTAVITQQMKTAKNRAYAFDISPHQNALVTAGGGSLNGTARPLEGNDSGVEKHSLNVVQGGKFAFNMSLPGSRWAVMSKDGKLVASGDTLSSNAGKLDVLGKTYKLDPGQYDVTVILPSKLKQASPWRLDLIPKLADAAPSSSADANPIKKILAEREARMAQWAQQDAQKAAKSG